MQLAACPVLDYHWSKYDEDMAAAEAEKKRKELEGPKASATKKVKTVVETSADVVARAAKFNEALANAAQQCG